MLIVLSYHRCVGTKYATPLPLLEKQLAFFKKNYSVVLPGDPISFNKTQLCLTFDDGYFDFYHHIFPLLTKLQLKCVLAVPAGLINEQTILPTTERLKAPINDKKALCTWAELKAMAQTPFVQIASHAYSHQNLLQKNLNLDLEINYSKELLENKLNRPITTFVYPKIGRAHV